MPKYGTVSQVLLQLVVAILFQEKTKKKCSFSPKMPKKCWHNRKSPNWDELVIINADPFSKVNITN